jgi:glycosyltransferase involved in cell wall biosynthesis
MSLSAKEQMLTVVIPAYNEEEAIGAVVDDIWQQCRAIVREVIVVDDGSRDNTAQIAKDNGAKVISHGYNRGYGASLKTGIGQANTDLILTMDADGQHNADFIWSLWEQKSHFDMVVGERTQLIHSPLWRMPGKWLLTFMARFLTQAEIPDLNSGLRIMHKDVVEKYMHLCPSGFSFSTTITMALHSRGYRVGYVPIQVKRRKEGSGTVSVKTGLNTIILILRLSTLFNPLRIFLPVSFFIGAVGFLWGIPYAIAGYGVSVGSMLAVSIAVLLFALGLISDQISSLRLEKYE